MQNKGAIRSFAIIFALICLYQLSFTFFARNAESKANAYAASQFTLEQAKSLANGNPNREKQIYDSLVRTKTQYYLDSIGNQVIYNILIDKYTYKECKEREINLGLDLRGGMNVTMEVSTSDVVRALASYSQDTLFTKVMDLSIKKNAITPNSNFVDIFEQTWNEVDPKAMMASIFSFQLKGDKINANSTNKEVVAAIKSQTTDAFDRTYQILRQRIDKFGVAQPNVQKLGTTERILVELPGIKDPERVRKLLQGTAQLEFWETYDFAELAQNLKEANDFLVSALKQEENEETAIADILTETKTETADTTEDLLSKVTAVDTNSGDLEKMKAQNPLFAVLSPSLFEGDEARKGPVVGYAQKKDMETINHYLELSKAKFPKDVRFVWSVKPFKDSDVYQLIAIKVKNQEGRPPLGGEVITDARQDYGQTGGVEISMSMNTEGARVWKNMTGQNIGKSIAVVMDNMAYSWPAVQSEITGGRSVINGDFTVEEGQDLANILKIGKLPAPARIVQEAVVGPSLGQEAISNSLTSFILAFIMVLLYMIAFYNRAGLVANVALIVNVFFIFGVLTSLGAVLTLSGIAGIVLTLGMAVDANVIIYERIKEELRAGKGVRLAVSDGYKNAYSAIIDGNVTTLLTGLVLLYFGTGPIQGFATTLCIGILTSLFTAIFITRMLFIWMFDHKKEVNFDNKITRNFLAKVNFDFIGKKRIIYIISIALSVLSIASLATRGLSLGIDFSGGRSYVIRFDQDVNANTIRENLTTVFGESPEVKTFGPNNQIKVTTKHLINQTGEAIDSIIETKLYEGTKSSFASEISLAEFNSDESDKLIGKLSSEMVGPTVATDITRSAFIALAIALAFIFVYIAIRFKHWQYGVGGLISLAHDALITCGVFSMFYGILPFSLDIDQAFIAAILTIIGYSINDTVIIFDRIREYINLTPKHDLKDTMNAAMNSTLARTVNTAGTTFVVVLMIFIFGGEVIRGFTFAILFGVVIGTYSSVFIASPIAFDLIQRKRKKIAATKK